MPLFSANHESGDRVHWGCNLLELLWLSEWMGRFSTVPHNLIHMRNCATICCLNLVLNIFAAIISHAPKLPRHFDA
jgi:hypothetical protein